MDFKGIGKLTLWGTFPSAALWCALLLHCVLAIEKHNIRLYPPISAVFATKSVSIPVICLSASYVTGVPSNGSRGPDENLMSTACCPRLLMKGKISATKEANTGCDCHVRRPRVR